MTLPIFANSNGFSMMIPSQPSGAEHWYGYGQSPLLSLPQRMPIAPSSQYSSSYDSEHVLGYEFQDPYSSHRQDQRETFSPPSSRDLDTNRAHETNGDYTYAPEFGESNHIDTISMAYQYSDHTSSRDSPSSLSPGAPSAQHHHHHHLPNQQALQDNPRLNMWGDYPSSPDEHAPSSFVGQPGMPEPAARPKGPKLKFTPEDDALLVELKETKSLTWKQIADFFPGRSSGTLQVRYCTKLKAKTTAWTDDMVQKLRSATQEYEEDRWRIIATKVGGGISATACRDKAWELEMDPSVDKQDEATDPMSASSVES